MTSKVYRVALAGNPNSGKTSIFNALSGARAHVGNYPGVTVEKRSARVSRGGIEIEFVDLPGIYSLSAVTLDEIAARDYILYDKPDLIVSVVDSGNLERNLLLATQLVETGVKVIVVLNMWDEAERLGVTVDGEKLSLLLGAPIVKTIGHKGIGIGQLLWTVLKHLQGTDAKHRQLGISYGAAVDEEIARLTEQVAATGWNTLSPRWYALNLLRSTIALKEFAHVSQAEKVVISSQVERSQHRIAASTGKSADDAIRDGRRDYIRNLLSASVKKGLGDRMAFSNRIDHILTHRFFGYPIFLFCIWLLFQATFVLGKYPSDWIDKGITFLSHLLAGIFPSEVVTGLVTQGIIGGVGSVLVFVPNIMILFLGISLMEDSGYMARAAFIMDRLMRAVGLHGKAFIPLLMGFGCNVPAIMASRTLESHRDRVLTILLIPFMSCSARLSVYVLFCSAFFPENPGNVIFALYLIGVLAAAAAGVLLKSKLFKDQPAPFIIEFPPYRRPTLKSGIIHMWGRGSVYLRKIGGVILVASVVLWFLGAFPPVDHYSQDYDGQIEALEASGDSHAAEAVGELESLKASERAEHSFIGKLGRFLEPVFAPLGFNWRMGVSIITGFIAKEAVVSSMGVLYRLGGEVNKTSTNLVNALRHPENRGTALVAFAFMVFVLLYTPCVSTVASVRREIGARWMWLSIGGQLTVAWLAAFLIYRAGLLLGLG